MKKASTALLVLALFAGAMAPAGAAKAKVVTLFEDPAGDADNAQGLGQSLPGGFDLVSGSVQKVGKDQLKFVVAHNDMPPTGSIGEAFRFIWEIASGSEQYEFTVKSLDIGKPDVIATAMGQSPNGAERVGQVHQGVARVEQCGSISLGITWSQCTAVSYVPAIFDTAAKTVTWTIKMADIKAKPGTVISGGAGPRSTTGCQICWVAQYAERSLTPQTIVDAATQTTSYKIPK